MKSIYEIKSTYPYINDITDDIYHSHENSPDRLAAWSAPHTQCEKWQIVYDIILRI